MIEKFFKNYLVNNQTNKKRIIPYLLFVIVIFFFAQYVYKNFIEIKNIEFVFKPVILISSFVLWCISYAGYSLIWRKIILSIDKNIKISKIFSFKMYVLTEFSKYIPGSVWSVFTRTYFSDKINTSKRNVLTASTIDAVLAVTTILAVGSVSLILYFSSKYIFLILLAIGISIMGFVLLHPKIFYSVANFALKKIGRDEIHVDFMVSYKKILYFSLQYILLNIIQSISFYLLVISITPISLNNFFLIVASFCLGIGLGIVAFFAPSGLGVREGIMTYIMSLIVSSPVATFIVIVSRLWMTIGEVCLLCFAFFLEKVQGLKVRE